MTTEIEVKFFKHFGIEPKFNDGCKLADEYWKNEELAIEYICFDEYMDKNCPEGDSGACFSTCKHAYDNIKYPEITDKILIELIAYNGIKTRNELKEEVLKKAIQIAGDNEYRKENIRELFNIYKEQQ